MKETEGHIYNLEIPKTQLDKIKTRAIQNKDTQKSWKQTIYLLREYKMNLQLRKNKSSVQSVPQNPNNSISSTNLSTNPTSSVLKLRFLSL